LAGVITVRRDGRRHIYAVDDPHMVAMVDQIFDHIAPDGTLAPTHPRPPSPTPPERVLAPGLRHPR
jgi:hypothetical protein